MKKTTLVSLICFTMVMAAGCSQKQEESQAAVSHSFYWAGTFCSGTYTGEMQDGRPHGTGTFQGYVMRDGKEQDEVSYTGKWREGKVAGKGVFTDITEGIVYEGKFTNNAKNGDFVVKEDDSDIYEQVSFYKDIPYGVSFFCNAEDGQVVGYDRYFKGIRVSEIMGKAQVFDYAELIYDMEEHYYKEIYLECQVEEKIFREVVIGEEEDSEEEPETELIVELKVKDAEENLYLVTYNIEYPKRAENYMPDIAEGDKLQLYGFIKGLAKKEGDASLMSQYPLIEAVTALKGSDTLDIKNLVYEYQSFLDHPYEYRGNTLELSGTVKQIGTDYEGQLFLILESDNYSGDEKKSYVCAYNSKDKDDGSYREIPAAGDEVSVSGELDTVYMVSGEEDYTLYPKVIISDIVLKK